MNTRIHYLYRDADNYKVLNSCVVEGEVTAEQKKTILSALDDGCYFIPEVVGLPAERFGTHTESDHAWMELYEDGFELVTSDTTVALTIEQVTEAFRNARWNEEEQEFCMPRSKAYGIIARHVFTACKTYGSGQKAFVILADDLDDAKRKALAAFGYLPEELDQVYHGIPSITVYPIEATDDPQVYQAFNAR